jgi:hypothetical protein
MKIKALKSGSFAHPEPSKGIYLIVEGKTEPFDEKMSKALIDAGWGEEHVEKKKSVKEDKSKEKKESKAKK